MTDDKPKRPAPLSAVERAKRAPLPPDVLMCARHDVVHVDKGGGRGLTVTADIRRAALEEAAKACAAAIRALLPAPEAKAAFKVGDRVRYVGDHPAFKGELGTVTEISTLFVALDNGARVSGAGTLFEPADPAPSAARPPLTGPELAAKDGFKPHGQPTPRRVIGVSTGGHMLDCGHTTGAPLPWHLAEGTGTYDCVACEFTGAPNDYLRGREDERAAIAAWLRVQIEREMIDESTPGRMPYTDATRRSIREAIYNVVSAIEHGEHTKESKP